MLARANPQTNYATMPNMRNILLTGGAGFVGHHVLEALLHRTTAKVVILDRLDESGNLNRLPYIKDWEKHRSRVRFVFHDLKAPIRDGVAKQIGPIDTILHLAAGTHVDRSIDDPLAFVYDNVVGTAHLLEFARRGVESFVYFSTDEVFGPAPEGIAYKEWDRYCSGNPYSATKAGAEELCLAYHNTYGVPVKITHCMNIFGERQHPEKFIPLVIGKVLRWQEVLIHSDQTLTQSGSRFYIHAANVADAVLHIMSRGNNGDKFNIVGELEVTNLELAQSIAEILGEKLTYRMVDFHSSRPGHDLRYALDGSKLAAMGWKPPQSFRQSLERVVRWTVDHPQWM